MAVHCIFAGQLTGPRTISSHAVTKKKKWPQKEALWPPPYLWISVFAKKTSETPKMY